MVVMNEGGGVEAKECIQHVSDKEEGLEDDGLVTKFLGTVPH